MEKNTCGTVGMWFSIIGLILCITMFFIPLGLICLIIGFILGLIGMFYKPKGKAITALIIPVIIFIIIGLLCTYVRNSVKTPLNDFNTWERSIQDENSEIFNSEEFNSILNTECNNISEEDITEFFKNSTGNNFIEKGAYTVFGLSEKCTNSAIEKYKASETEISDAENTESTEDSNIIEDTDENNEKEDENKSQEQQTETFSANEIADIEDMLNILE